MLLSHGPDHTDPALTAGHAYAYNGEFEFAVHFADADGIDPATLIGNGAAVSVAVASDGTPLAARYVGIDDGTVGPVRTVIYRTAAPTAGAVADGAVTDSGFASLGVGVTVTVNPNQVRDARGNPEPGIVLGPLKVYELPADVGSAPPGVPENVRGRLVNVLSVGGEEATTGLALRRVFADADADGAFDAGEASVLTDLDGAFAMFATPGTVVRAELSADWAPAPGTTGTATVELRPNTPELRYSMVAPVVVDVLVAYAGVASGPGFGDLPALRQRVRDEVVGANRYYANSETNILLDLAGMLPVWYPSNGRAKQDLQRLKNRRDGIMDEVHVERDRLGADLVVLIPSPDDRRVDRTLGIAYQLSRKAGDARSAFALVHSDNDPSTFAHEVGHLFGAGHEQAIQRDGITPYAHGLVADGIIDVMAYGMGGEQIVPFLSTPLFTYRGIRLGDPATADNARTVRQFAPVVSRYRQRPAGGRSGAAPAVDLAAAVDGRVSGPLAPGDALALGIHVTNVGTASAVGTVGFEVFLSTDDVLDEGDLRLGSDGTSRATLKPGRSKRFRFRLAVPAGVAPGSYHVLVRATGGPVGGELNLANNTASGPAVQLTA